MTYNLGSVRQRVQQKLDDVAFDTATLNQFINDGQRDIFNSRRFTFMERQGTVTTIASSEVLTTGLTDVQIPLSLRLYTPLGNANLLTYIEYEDFDEWLANENLVGKTTPSYWRIFNNTILLFPIPDAVYTLKIRYIKTPIELTTDLQVPEIPEEFSEVLVLAAFRRAQEFNDDNDQAQITQQQIDIQTTTMVERYQRQAGTPHIMKLPNRSRRVWS